ncbi:MAG: DUF3667 domain-containing protein [Gammaproteobacteria bacterium]|nr:DUF3667 domain-containing protein [Gammaproteobacteria bacterium]
MLEVELALTAAPADQDGLEDYLATLVACPEVLSVRRYRVVGLSPDDTAHGEPAVDTRWQCLLRFVLTDQPPAEGAALMAALHAAGHTLRERWGDALTITTRWLQGDAQAHTGALRRCRNCEAPVTGQYCWQCGQRVRERMITMGELIAGLTTDLFQFESRLWRSVRPLLLSPGRLTADYLGGRQARYMPPFRMYLVLSLAFFLLVTIGYGDTVVRLNVDDTLATEDRMGIEWRATRQDRGTFADENCRFENVTILGPGWLADYLTPELLRQRCLRIVERPEEYARRVLDAFPVALLLALPALALVMQLLHAFSGRYYVEHLLFFVHYHSFLFLFVMLVLGTGRLLGLLTVPGWASGLGLLAAWLYSLYYPYRAMRRVYENGRLLTLVKFSLLLLTYLLLLIFMTVGTLIYTALRV